MGRKVYLLPKKTKTFWFNFAYTVQCFNVTLFRVFLSFGAPPCSSALRTESKGERESVVGLLAKLLQVFCSTRFFTCADNATRVFSTCLLHTVFENHAKSHLATLRVKRALFISKTKRFEFSRKTETILVIFKHCVGSPLFLFFSHAFTRCLHGFCSRRRRRETARALDNKWSRRGISDRDRFSTWQHISDDVASTLRESG